MTERENAGGVRRPDLGVLVVHGIGDQKQGATLTAWTDAIVDWLNATGDDPTRATPEVRVRRAELKPSDGPATVELSVRSPATRRHQQWVLAEGWWASSFEPPSFGELWSWSFVSVPATAAMHANAMVESAVRRCYTARGPQQIYEVLRLGAMLLLLVGLVMISPLILGLLTLLLVLGLVASIVPIDALRTTVAKAQLVSIGTIGDTKRLIDSPTQSGAIKSPVADGIRHLRARGCRRIAIVAHSQGAAVTYKTLEDLSEAPDERFAPVDTFISVGSGLPKVHALEYLSSAAGRRIRLAAISLPVAAIVGALSLRWLRENDALEAITVIAIGLAIGLVLGGLLLARGFRSRQQGDDHKESFDDDVQRVLPRLPIVLALLFGLVYSVIATDQTVVTLLAMGSAVTALWAIHTIATRSIPPVANPLHSAAKRWVDLWASVDPVPAGPTHTSVPGRPQSWRVTNLGSIARDHNAYTANGDECVAHIGAELVRLTGLPRRQRSVAEASRRRNRVTWRSIATYLLLGASAVFAWTTWRGADAALIRWYGQLMAPDGLLNTWYPGDLPDFVPDQMSSTAAEIVSVVLYVLAGTAIVQIGLAAWGAWDSEQTTIELTRADDDEAHPHSFTGSFHAMIAVIAFAWIIAIVPRRVWDSWNTLDLTSWTGVAVVGLGALASLAIGRVLGYALARFEIERLVSTRDTSRIAGMVGLALEQLNEQQPEHTEQAIALANDAARAAEKAGHVSLEALAVIASAYAQRVDELEPDRDPWHPPTSELGQVYNGSALDAFRRACSMPVLVDPMTRIAYANQLRISRSIGLRFEVDGTFGPEDWVVIDDERPHEFRNAYVRQVNRVAWDDAQPPRVLAALSVHRPGEGFDLRVVDQIDSWAPSDQLVGWYVLLALELVRSVQGRLNSSVDDAGHDAAAQVGTAESNAAAEPEWRPILDSIEELLDHNHRAPFADLRLAEQLVVDRSAHEFAASPADLDRLRGLAGRITSLPSTSGARHTTPHDHPRPARTTR